MDFNVELTQATIDYRAKVKEIVEQLKQSIINLPDNKECTRISKNIVLVNFSSLSYKDSNGKLSSNWTPEFHNFKIQYEALVAKIERTKDFGEIVPGLLKVIATGKITIRHRFNWFKDWDYKEEITLNPAVIQNLKDLLNVK